MTVIIPRRRNNPSGRKTGGKLPTRRDTQQQPPATDPGIRGGVSIPAGAFTGASQGIIDTGNLVTDAGRQYGAQVQQDQNRADVLGTRVELNKLNSRLSGLVPNYDPIAGTFTDPDTAVIHSNGLEAFNTAFERKSQEFYTEVQKNPGYSKRMKSEFPNQGELVKSDVKGGFSTIVQNAQSAYYKDNLSSDLAMDVIDKQGLSVPDRIKRNHNIAHSLGEFSELGGTPNIYSNILSFSDRLKAEADANGNIFIKEIQKFARSRQFAEAKDYLDNLPAFLRSEGITAVSGASAEGVRLARKYLTDAMDADAHRLRAEAKDNKTNIKKVEPTINNENFVQFFDLNNIQKDPKGNPIPLVSIKKSDVSTAESKIYVDEKSGKAFVIEVDNNGNISLGEQISIGQTKAEEFQEEVNAMKILMPGASEKERLTRLLDKHYPDNKSALDEKMKWMDELGAALNIPTDDLRLMKFNIIHEQSDFTKKMQELVMRKTEGEIDDEEFKARTLSLINTTEPASIKTKRNLEWLKTNKNKFSEKQYSAALFRTRMGFDIPEGAKAPSTGFVRLVKDMVNEGIGGVKSQSFDGLYAPPEGLSKTALDMESRVINAIQSGLYEDGTAVKNTNDLFAIVNTIISDPEYADKLPVRISLSEQFDKAIHGKYEDDKVIIYPLEQELPENMDGAANLIIEEGQDLLSKERQALMLPEIKAELADQGLDVNRATGLVSTMQDFVGQLSQFGGDTWAREDVTKARLVFSLIARDYIRFVSLSPRFAVKEQELLREIYPGSKVLNSPIQAKHRLREFKTSLTAKMVDLRKIATDEYQDKSERQKAQKEAQVWANTIRNIDRFNIETPKTTTLEDIKKLNPKQLTDFVLNQDPDVFIGRLEHQLGKKKAKTFMENLRKKMTVGQ